MASERKFITENIRRLLLKEYLLKETKRAGFGGADIQRTPMGTRITLMTERPGLVIGRKGENIRTITETIEKDFKYDNPQIEVEDVKNPNLNPLIMAEKLASALERGWHFRRAGHSTVQRIMDAGAKGCRVIISGKLTGERHRTEKFVAGTIKFCGDSYLKFMRRGFAQAKLKPGVMGVTVEIMVPEAKLPDDIIIKEVAEAVSIVPPVPAVEMLVEETTAEISEETETVEKVETVHPHTAQAATQAPAAPVKIKEKKERAPKIKIKKLRKIVAEIKELGEDVDVELPVEDILPEDEAKGDKTKED